MSVVFYQSLSIYNYYRTLDNSGTVIRNLSAEDFAGTGLTLTADAVTNCIAVDSQGGLNDFSKCGGLKNVACQYSTLLTGSPE